MNKMMAAVAQNGGLLTITVVSPAKKAEDQCRYCAGIGGRPAMDQIVDALLGLYINKAISDIEYHIFGVILEESGSWSYGEEVEGGHLSDLLPHPDDLPLN